MRTSRDSSVSLEALGSDLDELGHWKQKCMRRWRLGEESEAFCTPFHIFALLPKSHACCSICTTLQR